MSAIWIRPATLADAGVIATLNIACWRETYAGLAPADALAELSVEERVEHWRGILGGASPQSVFLAVAEDGSAVGFSHCRSQRTGLAGRFGYGCEISAIYLLERAQRRGVGRRLMSLMAEGMRAREIRWASLWVLRDNLPARRFYEILGGRRIGAERLWRGVPEIVYGWRDLKRLTRGEARVLTRDSA
ncbi:MAG: GNAT family N-acetyltransferase [Methylocystaceae bacterium]|nr:MAG: GNAT family N-acetyltransferase [Methylocystaceae bacterium]